MFSCEPYPEVFEDDNVVAQFKNGIITRDQLLAYINKIGPKCHTPNMGCHSSSTDSGCATDKSCDMHDSEMTDGQNELTQNMDSMGSDCCGGEHGGEHSGCCGGTETSLKEQSCDEHDDCCMQHYNLTEMDYEELVKTMVLEEMLIEYISENDIGQEKNTQEIIKYVSEEILVTDMHIEMEESMKPAEIDIRNYYEENKGQFGLKTINEVRDEIINILKNTMHREYMPNYFEELKRNALIIKYMEYITPQHPSEYELQNYYREHLNEYEEPEKIRIRQILTDTREKIEQAQSRLRFGSDFEDIALEYSEGLYADSGGELPFYIKIGDRTDIFKENVFYLREGDVSYVFEDNGEFYIVQVIEKFDERVKSFDEVRDSIKQVLIRQNEEDIFMDNANRTLAIINDQNITVEEFKQLYDNILFGLNEESKDLSGKEKILDSMIEYRLLVDDASYKMFDPENKDTIQDITNSILQNTLIKKEIIAKIGINDVTKEETIEYYNENKDYFTQPAKAVISYIRIPQSENWEMNAIPTEYERDTAENKANEVYDLLKNDSDFSILANKYSADEWSFQKAHVFEEIENPNASLNEQEIHPLHERIFALNPGEISKPFEYMGNFYIFKLWEKEEKSYINFNVVEDVIKQILVEYKRNEMAETLVTELMEKSQLIINNRVLKDLVEND